MNFLITNNHKFSSLTCTQEVQPILSTQNLEHSEEPPFKQSKRFTERCEMANPSQCDVLSMVEMNIPYNNCCEQDELLYSFQWLFIFPSSAPMLEILIYIMPTHSQLLKPSSAWNTWCMIPHDLSQLPLQINVGSSVPNMLRRQEE